MSQRNKTVYPDNLVDTSAWGGVPMPGGPAGDTPRQPSVAGESIAGGDVGDGNDEDGGSAREYGFSAGSMGGAGKRKNMWQQTFDAIAEAQCIDGGHCRGDKQATVSSSRSDGFTRVEPYVTVDYPTDLAKTVWQSRQSVEWSRVVPPSAVYHTLALKLDIPLWYAGAYIEDRPNSKDGDMAGQQESTVMHLASCFHDALRYGQGSDGGKMSQSRLSRVADAFHLLLGSCVWVMRMGGDAARSYKEASYYVQLVASLRLWRLVHSPSTGVDMFSSPRMPY
ncbi:hypothetical protein CBR_g17828 [Chara braunii]|uniref:Uncharacterized protein n=1 Tax=Chara braunii TaxID=69332 RepID=A0A388KVP6_CHABU|nr:hypothetical protein CBR_g17828 [Chara braunii]|eukprot:GBG74117.1 hypothetical protein CBR_g17828 [Chara braunii]